MPKKILVIDDEYDIASTLELAFDMENHEVRLATHGKEALDILNNESLPDLIFSDIMMPVMNGYDFTKALRENPRFDNIPLILSSAATLDKKKLDPGSYQGFIRKPFDLSALLEVVEKELNK